MINRSPNSRVSRVILELVAKDGIPMRIARGIAPHDDWKERAAEWLQVEAQEEECRRIEKQLTVERRRQIDAGEGVIRGPVPYGQSRMRLLKPRQVECRSCGSKKMTRAKHHSLRCCDRRMCLTRTCGECGKIGHNTRTCPVIRLAQHPLPRGPLRLALFLQRCDV